MLLWRSKDGHAIIDGMMANLTGCSKGYQISWHTLTSGGGHTVVNRDVMFGVVKASKTFHTQTIQQHCDQVPFMDGIDASPHSVVTKHDLNVVTEHAPPRDFFPSNVSSRIPVVWVSSTERTSTVARAPFDGHFCSFLRGSSTWETGCFKMFMVSHCDSVGLRALGLRVACQSVSRSNSPIKSSSL
jgi:hypothetical protein